jgi:hypothetical protein
VSALAHLTRDQLWNACECVAPYASCDACNEMEKRDEMDGPECMRCEGACKCLAPAENE